MITKELIKDIYKQYPRRPKSIDQLDIPLLINSVGERHNITIDEEAGNVVVGSLEENSIFHTIRLANIHAIIPFEEWTAIVLHSTVVFFSRVNNNISVNIKPLRPTLKERIKGWFCKNK